MPLDSERVQNIKGKSQILHPGWAFSFLHINFVFLQFFIGKNPGLFCCVGSFYLSKQSYQLDE